MVAVRNGSDAASLIRAARRARGLTQAQLADRAGVGRQWLVAVEKGHDRAELGKVVSVLRAMGLTLTTHEDVALPDGRTWMTAADAADAIREELGRSDTGFALRLLGRALQEFEQLTDPADREAFLAEPPSTGDHRWDTLLAAATGRACRTAGVQAPDWTRTPPLPSWWFPVYDPVLTARTMQRTPVDLSTMGIWLDERALQVV